MLNGATKRLMVTDAFDKRCRRNVLTSAFTLPLRMSGDNERKEKSRFQGVGVSPARPRRDSRRPGRLARRRSISRSTASPGIRE